jgi:hypothetical protein
VAQDLRETFKGFILEIPGIFGLAEGGIVFAVDRAEGRFELYL